MTRDTDWFTSSYSGSGNPNCVEVRIVQHGPVHMRDSKNPDAGRLSLPLAAWAEFVSHVRR